MQEVEKTLQREEGNKSVDVKVISRRQLLITGAGLLATGLLTTAGLAGCGTTTATSTAPKNETASGSESTAKSEAAPPLPWKYNKVDPEAVRKRAYELYYKGACMYAVAGALITTLAETTGGPWKTIPIDMFGYGEGGAYGWGTLCGALNGGLAFLNLALGRNPEVGNDLLGWYTETPFPSDKCDSFAKFKGQVTSVSKSPLCHVSVGEWVQKAKVKVNSDERKDRCGKLCGDVAVKIAEMLNKALEEGKYKGTFKPTQEYISCMSCHNGKDSTLDNEQGKMNCVSCHKPHKV